MKLSYWLADLVGSNINQQGFYNVVFETLLEGNYFYPAEHKDWSARSRSRWLGKLTSLEIIELRRKGNEKNWHYRWSIKFLSRINDIWKIVKKQI